MKQTYRENIQPGMIVLLYACNLENKPHWKYIG
jgi:hypothetical protein